MLLLLLYTKQEAAVQTKNQQGQAIGLYKILHVGVKAAGWGRVELPPAKRCQYRKGKGIVAVVEGVAARIHKEGEGKVQAVGKVGKGEGGSQPMGLGCGVGRASCGLNQV